MDKTPQLENFESRSAFESRPTFRAAEQILDKQFYGAAVDLAHEIQRCIVGRELALAFTAIEAVLLQGIVAAYQEIDAEG